MFIAEIFGAWSQIVNS